MERGHLSKIGLQAATLVAATLRPRAPGSPCSVSEELPPPKADPAPSAAPPEPKNKSQPAAKSATEPVFFQDTFLFSLSGCQLTEASISTEPPKDAPQGHVKVSVVLDRTVFHPQGGGQPADSGILKAVGLPDLAVSFVSTRKEDGAVLHDGVLPLDEASRWCKAVGSASVECFVDEAKRMLNARLHSAGHLLDAAVKAVDLRWVPGKGFHFPDGPYVEYVLNDDSRKIDPKKAGDKETIMSQIQANMDELLSKGGPVNMRYENSVRHIEMAGEECPCGGTHVQDIAQIGKVEIKKLQNKQGNVRLSYTVAAVN